MFNGEEQRRNWFHDLPSAEMKLASLTKKIVLSIASLVRLEVHVHLYWFCLIITSVLLNLTEPLDSVYCTNHQAV